MRFPFFKYFSPAAAAMFLCACAQQPKGDSFSTLSEEFVHESLALSPVSATAVGFHEYNGAQFDGLLDDLSRNGLQRQHAFFAGFRARLDTAVDPSKLNAEDRADYDIIDDQISLSLLELETIQSYRHNPTLYVELLGNALFTPYSLEYAPKPKRYTQIISRLNHVPEFLANAKLNLSDSPESWNRVAQEENDGNIDLIDHTLRDACPYDQRAKYDETAAGALASIRDFTSWLRTDLAHQASDWRLGKSNYDKKFRYALGTDVTPEELLRQAEGKLRSIRHDMEQLAGAEGVKNALDRIAQKHATPETYFSDAKRDLAEAADYVRTKHLLTLPEGNNLDVIPTPAFMRGVYGVGGFNPAPALEPKLGAYYWITPVDPKWPKERIESKLREYNYYGLKILTIHEAMPGHWVQAQFAAKVQPDTRRVLRGVYGNGPYVEGWAVYATEVMVDEGLLNHDRDFQLTWYKQLLRAVANTVLDIRLQTMGMTEQQAMDLMLNQTYQEKEEAVGKWQRAQLSSCQLPMYFLGYQGWKDARQAYTSQRAGTSISAFHDAALAEGAVRLPSISTLTRTK